jgi:hypothetical protein
MRRSFSHEGTLGNMNRTSIVEDFEELLNVGIALSSVHDHGEAPGPNPQRGARLTSADAGTLYLVKRDKLIFKVSQCQSLIERWGEERMREMYQSLEMPISRNSIAGYAALTKKVLNIQNVKEIPQGSSFRYNPDWDERADYTTQSMMVVPMLNRDDGVVGVLQLINALEGRRVVPFPAENEKLASSLASQAAVAIDDAILAKAEAARLDEPQKMLEAADASLTGRAYWTYEAEVVGAGAHYLQHEADGVIGVIAFGCGPDSIMMDIVDTPGVTTKIDYHEF